MFATRNVYAMINGFRVRVKDARQKDRNHVIEIDLEIPLTFDGWRQSFTAPPQVEAQEWTPQ